MNTSETDSGRRILAVIENNPGLKSGDISSRAYYSRSMTNKILLELRQEGLIVADGYPLRYRSIASSIKYHAGAPIAPLDPVIAILAGLAQPERKAA